MVTSILTAAVLLIVFIGGGFIAGKYSNFNVYEASMNA